MAYTRLRSLTFAPVVTLALAQVGCSNGGGNPACTDSTPPGCHVDCSTSIEAYCATQPGGCDLTWGAVLADPSLCTVATQLNGWSYSLWDCGNYHVLSGGGESGGAGYYYDLSTGTLVAVTFVGHSPDVSCLGGPPGRFTPPNCNGATPRPPPICSADGGASADGGTDGP